MSYEPTDALRDLIGDVFDHLLIEVKMWAAENFGVDPEYAAHLFDDFDILDEDTARLVKEADDLLDGLMLALNRHMLQKDDSLIQLARTATVEQAERLFERRKANYERWMRSQIKAVPSESSESVQEPETP